MSRASSGVVGSPAGIIVGDSEDSTSRVRVEEVESSSSEHILPAEESRTQTAVRALESSMWSKTHLFLTFLQLIQVL